MNNLKLIDTKAARAAGYRALTSGYQLPQEEPMLANVLADMQRGKINHCLVEARERVAVWRAGGATRQETIPVPCPIRTSDRSRSGSNKPTHTAAGRPAQHRKGKRS